MRMSQLNVSEFVAYVFSYRFILFFYNIKGHAIFCSHMISKSACSTHNWIHFTMIYQQTIDVQLSFIDRL